MVSPLLLALIDPLSKLLDRVIPDPQAAAQAKVELLKLENQQALQELHLAAQADANQAAINLEEAKSQSLWVSGARPFILWVCGAAFAYHFVIQQFLAFALSAFGQDVDLPDLDIEELSTVLLGMLGLGSLRSLEKIKGVTK